jgi:mono/diheme cytochrome c family protein
LKRILLRTALVLAGFLVVLIGGLAAFAQVQWDRTFDIPEPRIELRSDPESIDRGRYLVFGPAHCSYCHTPPDHWARLDAGEELPLIGGYAFELPFGTLYSRNLTPDLETGIGRYTDGQLARMLRHNLRPDGRAAIPVMEFQNMSDEDVAAVIAYLRSAPPVRHAVPDARWNIAGKALMAMMIRPSAPSGTPPARSPEENPSRERGAYLANSVANCAGCHSPRSMMDGSYTGPRFSGGMMEVDGDPTHVFSVPNLTPDPATGYIVSWTEDHFVARFRVGKGHPGSHMPWDAFKRMSDDDLRSIYRYLMSLDPVENATGPTLQRKG